MASAAVAQLWLYKCRQFTKVFSIQSGCKVINLHPKMKKFKTSINNKYYLTHTWGEERKCYEDKTYISFL